MKTAKKILCIMLIIVLSLIWETTCIAQENEYIVDMSNLECLGYTNEHYYEEDKMNMFIVMQFLLNVVSTSTYDKDFLYSFLNNMTLGGGYIAKVDDAVMVFLASSEGCLILEYHTGNPQGTIEYSQEIVINTVEPVLNTMKSEYADFEWNDLYAADTLAAIDSILIYSKKSGDISEILPSSVALFQKNYSTTVNGREYTYKDRYALANKAVLNSSYVMPQMPPYSDGYAIAKGKSLEIKEGNYVEFNCTLYIDGVVKGDCRYKNSGEPTNYYLFCPNSVIPGDVIPVAVTTQPTNVAIDLQWSFSNPELISIDRNGLFRLNAEAEKHVGETITLTAESTAYIFYKRSISFVITTCIKDDALILPAKLTAIEDEAFINSSMRQVVFPSGLISIGNRAFSNCKELLHVFIPDGIISIADDAFDGCENVTLICEIDGDAAAYAEEHGIPFLVDPDVFK